MKIANHALWVILTEQDRMDPIEGIVISFRMADTIVKALANGERHIILSNRIANQVQESDSMLDPLYRQLMDKETGE